MLAFVFPALAATCSAQPKNPCFVFRLNGDVSVVCGNSRAQITHRGDIEDSAVSDEQAVFAYVTSRVTGRIPGGAIVGYTATLIDLKSGRTKTVEVVRPHILSTCGSIFQLDGSKDAPANRDLVSGKEIDVRPYVWFRCSADRKTVVGNTKNLGADYPGRPATSVQQDEGGDLLEGIPPTTKIAAGRTFDAYRYNISPDGSKVVHFDDSHPLCVFAATADKCGENGEFDGPASVNDLGEVLVSFGTGKTCYSRGSEDECFGIGYWKPGLKSIQVVEPVGSYPQWIRPETAELLRKWSTTSGGAAIK